MTTTLSTTGALQFGQGRRLFGLSAHQGKEQRMAGYDLPILVLRVGGGTASADG